MTPSLSPRSKVFISYSHNDEDHLRRLQVHLAQDVRNKHVDLWDDTSIKPGMKWPTEITNALAAARVAVLLVSVDFLASEFISEVELPSLLNAAENEGVTILPVLIRPCRYEPILGEFQFVNRPLKPLIEMTETQREETWVKVAKSITEALDTPLPPASLSSPPDFSRQRAGSDLPHSSSGPNLLSSGRPVGLPPRPGQFLRPSKTALFFMGIVLIVFLTVLGINIIPVLGHIASTPPTAVPTKGRTSTATPIANVTPPPVPTGGGTSTATAIPGVTPTPCAIGEGTPPSQIYSCATKGRPVLDDTLQAQNADNWSTGSKPNGSCAFVNQAYQVTTTFPDYYQLCVAQTSSFGKFAFQVDMSILSGDAGGLIFRSNSSHFYAFTFCSEQSTCGGLGVGGYYALYAIDVSAAPGLRLVGQNVKSAALNPRLGVSNTLAVVALGNDIYLYANGQYVDYAPNIGLSVGQIGVTAYDPKGSSALTQVAFSNAKVWQL